MFTQLETSRLNLKKYDLSDVEGYSVLLTDESTYPFIVENGPIDPAQIISRIKRNRMATRLGTSLYWTARLKGSNDYVGFAALHASRSKRPVLSYAILPKWRRQGYASEAIRAILEFAIGKKGKSAVLARTHLDNQAFQSLLKSLGFRLAGTIDWAGSKRLEFICDFQSYHRDSEL